LGERLLTFQGTAVPFSSGLYSPRRVIVGPYDPADKDFVVLLIIKANEIHYFPSLF
jgi:hypothetical protein